MISVQFQPFVTASWWATMVEKGIKDKGLEEVTKIILDSRAST